MLYKRMAINIWSLSGILLSLHVFLFFVIIILITGYNYLEIDREFFVYSISVVIIVSFFYAIFSWRVLTGQIFDPYIIFLIAAMFFTGGQAIVEIFNIKPASFLDVYNRVDANYVLSALFLASLGLLFFQAGGTLAALQGVKSIQKKSLMIGINDLKRQKYALRTVGWIMLFISIYPTIQQIQLITRAVFSGGYISYFQIDRGTGLDGLQRILSLFFVPGILFLLSGSRGKIFPLFISAILMISHTLAQLFIGSRMLALIPLVAYGWLWDRLIRPLPRMVLLFSSIIIFVFVFPSITVYRQTAGVIRLNNPSLFWNAFFSISNPLIATITEMASTISTIAWTIELVPATRPYGLGSSYFYSFFGLVPNLFWDVHPVSTSQLSRWLSQKVTPDFAAIGGGWGYSFVAEAYFNFGWIGTPVIMLVMGYFYARFVLWAVNSNELPKMALLASFSSFFYVFARGEFSSIPRNFVWYSLFPYALTMIIFKVLSVEKNK